MFSLIKNNVIVKMMLILIIGGIFGIVALMAVFSIPTQKIEKHVCGSVPVLLKETNYHSVTPGIGGSQLDNYTEAIYMNEALVGGSKFKSALSGFRYDIPSENGAPVEKLAKVCSNQYERVLIPESSRFFNGYELIIKPLFWLMDYSNLRQAQLFIVFFLYLSLCYLMINKGLAIYIIPFTLSFLLLNPVTISLNMTFVFFYYCTIIPCIFLLVSNEWLLINKYRQIFFFQIIGMAAFYFNMNYFQLITFGIPLSFFYLLNGVPSNNRTLLIQIVTLFSAWFWGYAGMMIFKWIIYASFFDHDYFIKMYHHIMFRTSDSFNDVQISRIKAIITNMEQIESNKVWIVSEIIFIIYCSYKYIMNKSQFVHKVTTIKGEITLFIVLCIFPIARFFIYANHVYIHSWVTYRIMMISVFAFNVLCVKFCLKKL
ncbi:hypothetical protein [Succinivibrio dextrinosolvens]|uniref:hypothetical protein n=1 Tax=Succinivibrio dextrinosolvens TaxID=83771 RepID=UPI00192054B0|nr:hypothetical protein [Succinivibrio dextrinosolvens]